MLALGDRLRRLREAGVSVWLDDLSRDLIDNDVLTTLMRTCSVTGVTTNPTILARAISEGEGYGWQLEGLAAAGTDVIESVRALTIWDVQAAAGVLREVWERTDGVDGRVSLEVDPRLAEDADGTVAQAIELWELVDRPNLMVKIPATPAGLSAVTETIAAGVNVNVTLVFSAERCAQAADAYLAGLALAREAGRDLSRIHSVVSLFVSRVDTEVDARLVAIGETATDLRGRAATANARLAHSASRTIHSSERWSALAREGAKPQRVLWASTGVKDPAYPDTKYVTELVTPGTVSTMPSATLAAFADHGEVLGDLVLDRESESAATLEAVTAAGVDLLDVYSVLERRGVDTFVDSWAELTAIVAERLHELRPAHYGSMPT